MYAHCEHANWVLPQVFCVEIEYVRTGEVFNRLTTKSLPYIFHVSPQLSTEGGGYLKLSTQDAMQVGFLPGTLTRCKLYNTRMHSPGCWLCLGNCLVPKSRRTATSAA